MHIAYLIPTIDRIAGAERQLMLLANGMAHRGWHVSVIALSGNGGSAAAELSANNVSFLSLEMTHGLFDPRGWNRLRRWIGSAQPDILHTHLPHATLMGRGVRLLAPVRVQIDTIHTPATGPRTRQLGYCITSRIPDCVTAVSRAAARPWLNACIIDPRTAIVFPNAIDTAQWKPRPQQREARPKCAFRWLAVGRLDPVKDHATLLAAFALLPRTARLMISGSGPLESALRAQAARLGIHDRVSFLGFQNEVRALMHNSDAFVLSSRWEGLPVALMEACACELPAAFTETEGCRELLPDSPLPIAPVGNAEALAAAMQAMMEMPESTRRELGTLARRRILARFDLQSVLNRFELLYSHLLAANPRPARYRTRTVSALETLACSTAAET